MRSRTTTTFKGGLQMAVLKNLWIPNEVKINYLQLLCTMREMFREARAQCKKHGSKMAYCGKETRWVDCFGGGAVDNTIILCFQYNVGDFTYAVKRTFEVLPSVEYDMDIDRLMAGDAAYGR
jgi:hypothetical protein